MATGKIKTYQILVGGFRFIILPIDYVLLMKGFPPESVFFVTIAVEIGCLWFRLYRLKVQIEFPSKFLLLGFNCNNDEYFLIMSYSPIMFIVQFQFLQ